MRLDVSEAELYLKNLIQAGENQQLDFKFEISDAKKMAKTFSAFANTDGGRLLIGVKDNGKISGVKSEEEAYMAESSAHIFCKPAVRYNLKKWIIDGKVILEVEVPASRRKPHFAKDEKGQWIAYMRVHDQNIKAGKIQIEVWRNQDKKNGAWLNYGKEEKILISYLNMHESVSLSEYMKIARTSRQNVEKILVNLVLMKVIEMVTTDKNVFFRLHP